MTINEQIDNRGSAVILLVVLLLSSILVITMISSDIIRSGLQTGKTQIHSTKAYFAAEAGIEEILWEIRKTGALDTAACNVGEFYDFVSRQCSNVAPAAGQPTLKAFGNGATNYIIYANVVPVIFSSYGSYNEVRRAVEIRY